MHDINNRVAFITGAAGGIGLAIGQALAEAGAKIVLADIDEDELAKAVSTIQGEVLALPLDVTDRAAWIKAREAAEARFGQVDILCNNAGIAADGRGVADTTLESFDRVIRINVTGVFNGIEAFLPGMLARRSGHIVNTASMSGLTPVPMLATYGASKFAVVGFSEAMRVELAPSGIGVSVLCPGRVATRIAETTRAQGSDRLEAVGKMNPDSLSMEPIVVGRMVRDAIQADELYIITHPSSRAKVEQRFQALMAAYDRAEARQG